MARLKEPFHFENMKLDIDEDVEIGGVFESTRCRSGMALNTYFKKRNLRIDGVCCSFFFSYKEIELLRNPETRKTFFDNFIAGEQYGI